MDITKLNENFGLPGVLAFEDHEGLTRAAVTTPSASATVYLQGAHVATWQPTGEQPVLFLSERSAFKQGKAIRGGVPVIFPWFGDRHDGHEGPAHGFARTAEWEFGFAALAGDDLHMSLLLTPSDATRALGFDHFRVSYHLVIGKTLAMNLTVASDGDAPLVFEEALHTYLAVGDIHKTSVSGLHQVSYLDKRDGGAQKTQAEDPLILARDTDRVYLDTRSTCVVDDQANNRKITVAKSNSGTTIVWNPWADLTAKMADMEPDSWQKMICVEGANAADASITLVHGEVHHMGCGISVESV